MEGHQHAHPGHERRRVKRHDGLSPYVSHGTVEAASSLRSVARSLKSNESHTSRKAKYVASNVPND